MLLHRPCCCVAALFTLWQHSPGYVPSVVGTPCVPPGDVEDDPAGADVLEDGDGLGVGHALEGKAVHGQHLVT